MSKLRTVQRDRRWLYLAAALLAVITLLYLPVVGFPFLQIDDNPHLLQEDLAQVGFGWSFTNPFAWQPLTWMSHQMDFRLFGIADAGQHHVMSLLLHLLNTGLFFWWLSKVTGEGGASLAAAALFALHPLRVESVAWVSGRGDLLATLFVLLALEAHRRERWWAVIPLSGLAMMASPAAAPFGLVIFGLDRWVLSRPLAWREIGPVLALGAIALVLRANGGPDHDVLLPTRADDGWATLPWQFFATLWPVGLSIARPITSSVWGTAAGAIFLLVLNVAWRNAPTPMVKIGLAWFGWLLLPGLLPSVWGRADHVTYLPHLGLMMALVFAIPAAWRVLTGKALVLVLVVLTALSWVQIHHFQGTVPLLLQAVAMNPTNAETRLALGLALAGQGSPAEAEKHFQFVTRIRPDSALAWVGYSRALTSQKRSAEALAVIDQSVKTVPRSGEARFERGIALQNVNRVPEAEQVFADALNLGLDARTGAIAYNNLGSYAAQRKEFAKAEKLFEQAFLLNLGFALAHRNYAMTLVAQNQRQKAIQHLERKAVLWTNNDRIVGEYLAQLMTENYSEQYKKEQEQVLREQALEQKGELERQKKR